MKVMPIHFPETRGPWGVDCLGGHWYVMHKDGARTAKKIGPIVGPKARAGRPNWFDRAMIEAERRNRAEAAKAAEARAKKPRLRPLRYLIHDSYNVSRWTDGFEVLGHGLPERVGRIAVHMSVHGFRGPRWTADHLGTGFRFGGWHDDACTAAVKAVEAMRLAVENGMFDRALAVKEGQGVQR